MVGAVRDLARRARRLGRHRRGMPRRGHRREARRRRRLAPRGLPRARAPAGARASDGSATGGTRSSSGSRPTSRGGSRSTRSTAPLRYLDQSTFHPTFLYELLWDFAAAAVLVYVIERRLRPRPPGVFAAYIALYCVGRFVEELLRIDPAHEIAGLRLNAWVSLIGIVAGVTWYVLSQRSGRPSRAPPEGAAGAKDGRPARQARPTPRLDSAGDVGGSRPRAGPRRVRGPVRPPPDTDPQGAARACGDRHRLHRRRVRRAPDCAGRDRPRRLRGVSRPDRRAARDQGAAALPRGGRRARGARAGGGGGRACAAARRVPAHEGGRRVATRASSVRA